MKISAILLCLYFAVCYAEIKVLVENVTVMDGERRLVIPCKYESDFTTIPTIVWYSTSGKETRLYTYKEGDDTETYKNAEVSRDLEIEKGALVLPDVTVTDNLEFSTLRCEVNFGAQGSKSADLDLLVYKLPSEDATVIINPYGTGEEGFDISESKVAIGSCSSSLGYPSASIVFYRKDKDGNTFSVNTSPIWSVLEPVTVNTGADGVSTTTSKDLVKLLDAEDDEAEFICSVITKYGEQTIVQNYTMPMFHVKYTTNNAELTSSATYSYLGDTITLTCKANGFPKPTIYIDDEETSSVDIEITADMDMQEFKCAANNGEDDIESSFIMDVLSLSEPVIVAPVAVMLGDSVTLNCTAEGEPAPEVAWYKGDAKIIDSGTYTITITAFEDSAEYICRADNGHVPLEKSSVHELSVKGISLVGAEMEEITDFKKDENVDISCVVTSNPKATITWDDPEVVPAVSSMVEYTYQSTINVGPITHEFSEKEYICTAENEDGLTVTKTFKFPVIEEPSSPTAGIIIAILVILLIVAIILAVLYNKGIICKKQEKGEESAEGDIAVEINNEEADVEAGNGKPDDGPAPPEEEKLMNGDGTNE